jgi:hypothetical protein
MHKGKPVQGNALIRNPVSGAATVQMQACARRCAAETQFIFSSYPLQ